MSKRLLFAFAILFFPVDRLVQSTTVSAEVQQPKCLLVLLTWCGKEKFQKAGFAKMGEWEIILKQEQDGVIQKLAPESSC